MKSRGRRSNPARPQSLTAAGPLLKDKNPAFNNPAGMNLSTIRTRPSSSQDEHPQSQLVLYRDILASPNLTDPTVRTDIINLREQTVGKNIDAFNSQQAAIAGVPGAVADQARRTSGRRHGTVGQTEGQPG